MYAIAFDLDTKQLQAHYHNTSWENSYGDVKKLLEKRNFTRQQESLYFGNANVDAVACVLVVVELASTFPWFAPAVTDIRMLRIEDLNDLKPAVKVGAAKAAGSKPTSQGGNGKTTVAASGKK